MTKLKLLSIMVLIVLSGCGQKGALTVKPPEQTPSKVDLKKTAQPEKDSEEDS